MVSSGSILGNAMAERMALKALCRTGAACCAAAPFRLLPLRPAQLPGRFFSARSSLRPARRSARGTVEAMRAASLLPRPPRAARLTSRAARSFTDRPAESGRICTGPPRCWRKGRKKGLPLSRQSFLYGGDWQNSAVGSPMQSAYFAAALFFCLLMVEIPSMASTMARMTSSTPRIA